ncbi:MAG: tyrosine-type recombinase/integrase [Nannocystales bacterium]
MALLPEPTVESLVAAFEQARLAQVEHGLLKNTSFKAYQRYARFGLLTWFKGRHWSSIKPFELAQMQAGVASEQGVTVGRNALAEARRTGDFGINNGLIVDGYNPASSIKLLRQPKPVRRPVPQPKAVELFRLLRGITYLDLEVKSITRVPAAALLLIESTGMRAGEACFARRHCWDSANRILTLPKDKVRAHRSSDKQIPVPRQGAKLLDDIIAGDIPGFPEHGVWFFPGKGAEGNITDLSTARKAAFAAVGIDPRTVTHDLRHTLAEAMHETEPLETVATMLGHLDIRTTRRYVGDAKPRKASKAAQRTADRLLGDAPDVAAPQPKVDLGALRDLLIRSSLLRDVPVDVLEKLKPNGVDTDQGTAQSIDFLLNALRQEDGFDA